MSAELVVSTFPDRHALAMIPGGNAPAEDSYPASAIPICLRLLAQLVRRALSRADWIAGSSIATSTPMIAITTRTSMSVKPRDGRRTDDIQELRRLRVGKAMTKPHVRPRHLRHAGSKMSRCMSH